MASNSIPSDPPARLAQDEAFAMALARQECVDAGLGSPEILSDDFVRASQRDRLSQIQGASHGSPQPDAPASSSQARAANGIHEDGHRAFSLRPVVGKQQTISNAFRDKFNPVGGDSAEEREAAKAHALEVQRTVTEQCDMVPVRGDGNCGYYTVLAGAVRKAVEDPHMRQSMISGLRDLSGRDWSEALARIAGDPLHSQPNQAAGAQEPGKQTLRRLADLLASPNPSDALKFIEHASNERALIAAQYILRAVVATDGVADPDNDHGAGCSYARPEDIDVVFRKLTGIATASCVSITTCKRNGDFLAPLDDILRDSRNPTTLLVLHSNGSHYDLLLHKAPMSRL